jgi:hypothetical protein
VLVLHTHTPHPPPAPENTAHGQVVAYLARIVEPVGESRVHPDSHLLDHCCIGVRRNLNVCNVGEGGLICSSSSSRGI